MTDRKSVKGETKFVWDANQRMVESITNGCKTAYKYDPFGRRISKETSGNITFFYWDENILLGDIKLEHSLLSCREWIYYPETFEPLVMVQNSNIYIYHNDPNGLPIRVLDDLNGNRISRTTKIEYGGEVSLLYIITKHILITYCKY